MTLKEPSSQSNRVPTIIIHRTDDEHIAIRFSQIGDKQRFRLILQRFRADFLLANCQVINGQPWWIVKLEQITEVREFGRRNGLKIAQE